MVRFFVCHSKLWQFLSKVLFLEVSFQAWSHTPIKIFINEGPAIFWNIPAAAFSIFELRVFYLSGGNKVNRYFVIRNGNQIKLRGTEIVSYFLSYNYFVISFISPHPSDVFFDSLDIPILLFYLCLLPSQ